MIVALIASSFKRLNFLTPSQKSRLLLTWFCALVACFCLLAENTEAQSLTSRLYDQANGFLDPDPVNIFQTNSGALLISTQGASFVFNGQAFLPLGKKEGLPGATAFQDIRRAPDGKTIVAIQGSQIFVAQDNKDFSLPNLQFTPVPNFDYGHYPNFHLLTTYDQGMIVVSGSQFEYLDLSNKLHPKISKLPDVLKDINQVETTPLAVFGHKNLLWVSAADGRICVHGSINRCWGTADGLPARQWGGFLDGPHDNVIARSSDTLVTIDPVRGSVTQETLPDVNPALETYAYYLRIEQLPNGDLMTQSLHGVVIRHNGTWKAIKITDGESPIWAMHYGSDGSIWLGVAGEGLRQAFGYQIVENWAAPNGLSNNMVWGVTRQSDGRIWVATDRGLDLLQPFLPPRQMFESRTVQTLASGPNGIIWLLINANTLERLDTRTGVKLETNIQDISTLRIDSTGTLWVVTSHGLYSLRDDDSGILKPVLQSSSDISFSDLTFTSDQTMWLTGSSALWRKLPGKPVESFISHWPEGGVQTEVVAHMLNGTVWVGTSNGLFRVDTSRVTPRVEKIPSMDLPSQTVNALLVDHDQTLWVGTSNGLAVYRDGKWVSADVSAGLVGNDIDQDGLYEDVEGSVWVGTSKGLTHILHPDSFNQVHILAPSIFDVSIDGKSYHGEEIPYSQARLEVQLGVLNNPNSARIHYRYKFEKLDAGWAEVASSQLNYPVVPAGHQRLLIEAYDPLTHVVSHPVGLAINMELPWWRQTWAIAGAGIILVALAGFILRLSYQLHQQVLGRKADFERNQAALEALAHQDPLTGLMNRRSIQKALTAALHASRKPSLAVGLIDIDHFKNINDTYGHLAGDAVLTSIAHRFMEQMQPLELLGRFGGEEYVIAVPDGSGRGLARIKAIIAAVTSDPISYGADRIKVTVSAGITAAQPDDRWETIIERSDVALYKAKRAGRNRVVSAEADQAVEMIGPEI